MPHNPEKRLKTAIPRETEAVATQVVEAFFRVHRTLGPGLLERVYEECVAVELQAMGLRFRRQAAIAVDYHGRRIENAFFADLLVEGLVIVELKAVENLLPVHTAQLLTYLKLADCRLGFLVNFNSPRLASSLKRYVR